MNEKPDLFLYLPRCASFRSFVLIFHSFGKTKPSLGRHDQRFVAPLVEYNCPTRGPLHAQNFINILSAERANILRNNSIEIINKPLELNIARILWGINLLNLAINIEIIGFLIVKSQS